MRVGITADLHLTTKDSHPERYNAFLNILQQCKQNEIERLIISGDLFDAPLSNYSEFESICKSSEFSKIELHIIPGNHDANINNKQIVATNVRIFDQPACIKLADGWEACFIPYRDAQTMGKAIGDVLEKGDNSQWALIGHGDWFGSFDEPNPYEDSKIYMPLTRKELDMFKPDFVFLGHIHVPQKNGNVYYAGSPCPVAANETGYRRFLTLDTEYGKVDEIRVYNDFLFFNARLMVMPTKDEENLLLRQIEACKLDWNISENDIKRVKIRVDAIGYSNDREFIVKTIEKGFDEFEFLDTPDVSKVGVANDIERNFIIEQFQEKLKNTDYPIGEEGQPDKEQITLKAMELVYGGRR